MNHPAANPHFATVAREYEACLVADLLRITRLTVLYGEPGAGKTTLLKGEVLRLLGRRADDRCMGRRFDGVVIPFPDRRIVRERPIEIALYFDSWGDSPLLDLQTRIASAPIMRRLRVSPPFPPFVQSIGDWSRQLGVRFLFIFDRFEHFAQAPRTNPGIAEFDEAFIGMANQPLLPANFLISIRDEADPLLDRYRARIAGFGDASVRLPRFDRIATRSVGPYGTTQRGPVELVAREAEADAVASDRVEPKRDLLAEAEHSPQRVWEPADRPNEAVRKAALAALREWDATMHDVPATRGEAGEVLRESQLTDGAALAGDQPANEAIVLPTHEAAIATTGGTATDTHDTVAQPSASERPTVPTDSATNVRCAVIDAASDPVPDNVVCLPSRARPTRPVARWIALSLVGTALAVVATRSIEPDAPPTTNAPDASSVADVVAPQPAVGAPETNVPSAEPLLPRVTVAVDGVNDTDVEVSRDLARLIARDAGVDIRLDTERSERTPPTLAITSFDALRPPPGTRRAVGSSDDAFAIVMPLYTEEVHALVRRDSPLRYLHEIRGARINVGPAGTGSHTTATRLYARMFDTALPATLASELPPREALQQLVRDGTIDIVLIVQAQPVRWLADLPSDVAAGIRALALDANHVATGSAVEDYVPTRIRAANYRWLDADVPTLATMAFMIADKSSIAANAEQVATLASTLCERLPALRSAGHPKWREVQPGLRIDGGWQLWPPAQSAIDSCEAKAAAGNVIVHSMSTRGAAR